MTRLLFFLIICNCLLAPAASSQWKKIYDFPDSDELGKKQSQPVSVIYFLDLAGPPRVGYAGTVSDLWKTTDGGLTWEKKWGHGGRALYWVTDICFKDSMVGWFTMYGDTDACYRTTDGGEHWKLLCSAESGGQSVYYCEATNRLFVGLINPFKGGVLYSTDLGDTWKASSNKGIGGFSFSTDLIGLVAAASTFPDTSHGVMRTTNGGVTWTYIKIPLDSQAYYVSQPLAIPGSPTCFVSTDGRFSVWRSNDYGATWKKIYDKGPYYDSAINEIAAVTNGYIKGDLNRLYIQTLDSGMYVSTDEGQSWWKDGGPSYDGDGEGNFYVGKGVAMAGKTPGYATIWSGGLWEEQYPFASVESSEANTTKAVLASPNPTHARIAIDLESPASYEVLDVLGIVRMRGKSDEPTLTLDVSSLPAGTYLVRVANGTKDKPVKFVKE